VIPGENSVTNEGHTLGVLIALTLPYEEKPNAKRRTAMTVQEALTIPPAPQSMAAIAFAQYELSATPWTAKIA